MGNAFDKDGDGTKIIEAIPGGGYVTAPFHGAAGNSEHAAAAVMKGNRTGGVLVYGMVGGLLGGPAGALAGAAAANTAFMGAEKLVSSEFKNEQIRNEFDHSTGDFIREGVVAGLAAGVGAKIDPSIRAAVPTSGYPVAGRQMLAKKVVVDKVVEPFKKR
jgi:hypothetical protein